MNNNSESPSLPNAIDGWCNLNSNHIRDSELKALQVIKYSFLKVGEAGCLIKSNNGIYLDNCEILNYLEKYIEDSHFKKKEKDKNLSHANLIINRKKLVIRKFKSVRVNFDWVEDPYNSRSWELYYHGFDFGVDLIYAYEFTKDDRYILFLINLIKSWIIRNDLSKKDLMFRRMAWNDHSSTLRLMLFSYLFKYIKNNKISLDNESIQIILNAIEVHVIANTHDDFFNHYHNHGLFQAISVIYTSLVFNNIDISLDWKKYGISKAIKYISYAINKEGVHKEHSAGYHYFAIKHFKTLLPIFEKINSGSLDKQNITKRMQSAEKFFDLLQNDDGSLVPYGDTVYGKKYCENKYIPNQTSRIFCDAGYASFKKIALHNNTSHEFHMFFTNSCFSKTHKHMDNLGIYLRANGEDWIIDSGMSPYSGDKYRRHCLSIFAHSTIAINNISPSLDKLTKCVTENISKNRDSVSVAGRHNAYYPYILERKIFYDLDNKFQITDSVMIQDKMKFNSESIIVDTLFQFPEDKIITINYNSVIITSENSRMSLYISYMPPVEEFNIDKISGQNKPYLLGWYYPMLKPTVSQVVRFRIIANPPVENLFVIEYMNV